MSILAVTLLTATTFCNAPGPICDLSFDIPNALPGTVSESFNLSLDLPDPNTLTTSDITTQYLFTNVDDWIVWEQIAPSEFNAEVPGLSVSCGPCNATFPADYSDTLPLGSTDLQFIETVDGLNGLPISINWNGYATLTVTDNIDPVATPEPTLLYILLIFAGILLIARFVGRNS